MMCTYDAQHDLPVALCAQEETEEERGRRIASQWTTDPDAAAPVSLTTLFDGDSGLKFVSCMVKTQLSLAPLYGPTGG